MNSQEMKEAPRKKERSSHEQGVALVMVLFVVALSSIIITQLTYTGTLDTSLHLYSKRSLESEYLLKSTINFGRALLKTDISPEDSERDFWGPFLNGLEIPKEILNIQDPAVRIELEIRPEEAKLPLRSLVSGRRGNEKWRDVFVRFFQKMGFDDDNLPDESGLFPGRVFSASEVVANLIDYMDPDSEDYQASDFPTGIESTLDKDVFANKHIRWLGELHNVPGMNQSRIRRISPFLTAFGSGRRININLAPRAVLESLSPEIGQPEVDAIIAFRSSETPFDNQNKKIELSLIVGQDIYDRVAPMIDVQSRWFQIIAKVDYGASTSFMRAYVSQTQTGELPIIRISEIFS